MGEFAGATGIKMDKRDLFRAAAAIITCTSAFLGQVPDRAKVVSGAERAFDKVSKTVTLPAPGCAVGVSLNGEVVFEKAFGLAEMDHGVPNRPQTVFESGSVAKQFTAASLVLLQQEGKLSIDDPVRKYIPELPDYGTPLTIRHMLNHTSGLRDWFSVRALSGEGAGEHIVTQQMIFDTIVRQKGLDFAPGSEYSYSNSGYQLAAMIVERVSKQKFPDFVGERFFKPLGMTTSSWRDDHRRVVQGRAHAYSRERNGPWRLNMPAMNAHGGGGMLTTAGDWLKWNAMLDGRTWNAGLVDALETQGILNHGRKLNYALGLTVSSYKGFKQVAHGGATAGYRTVLARYPDQKLSIAILCNGTEPNANELGYSISDEILGPFPTPAATPDTARIPIEQQEKYVGLWKNERTRAPIRLAVINNELRFGNTPIRANGDGSILMGSSKMSFKLDGAGKPESFELDMAGDPVRFTAQSEWAPTAADLAPLAADWYSDDAEAKLKFVVEGASAFLVVRHSPRLPLRPLYKDHFSDDQGQIIWFDRDASGKPTVMHIGGSRMRDMPFSPIR